MEKIHQVKSVSEYTHMRGGTALHPLVTVLDYKNLQLLAPGTYRFGLFCVFLKETKCGDIRYGKQTYDYQEESLVCIAPGQVVGVDAYAPGVKPKGKALVFHPDFIKGSQLANLLSDYSFFSYTSNEALHLSKKEKTLVEAILEGISTELQQNLDQHSKSLVLSHLQLLLNYAKRFYDRQFITRQEINKGVLERFEAMLQAYFQGDKPQTLGLPTVAYCAQALHLSPNYFGDLVKKETGISAQAYIHEKIIDLAKERIFDIDLPLQEIAYGLGFKYPQHFTRLFRQKTGMAPNDYRRMN